MWTGVSLFDLLESPLKPKFQRKAIWCNHQKLVKNPQSFLFVSPGMHLTPTFGICTNVYLFNKTLLSYLGVTIIYISWTCAWIQKNIPTAINGGYCSIHSVLIENLMVQLLHHYTVPMLLKIFQQMFSWEISHTGFGQIDKSVR